MAGACAGDGAVMTHHAAQVELAPLEQVPPWPGHLATSRSGAWRPCWTQISNRSSGCLSWSDKYDLDLKKNLIRGGPLPLPFLLSLLRLLPNPPFFLLLPYHTPQVSGKYDALIFDQMEEAVSVSSSSTLASDIGKVQK